MMAIESKIRTCKEAAVRRFWPRFTPFTLPIEGSKSGSVSFAPVGSYGRLRTSRGNFSGTGDGARIQLLGQIKSGTLLLGLRSAVISKTSDRRFFPGSSNSSPSSALDLLPEQRRAVVGVPVSLEVSEKNISGLNQVLVALASHLDANQ